MLGSLQVHDVVLGPALDPPSELSDLVLLQLVVVPRPPAHALVSDDGGHPAQPRQTGQGREVKTKQHLL